MAAIALKSSLQALAEYQKRFCYLHKSNPTPVQKWISPPPTYPSLEIPGHPGPAPLHLQEVQLARGTVRATPISPMAMTSRGIGMTVRGMEMEMDMVVGMTVMEGMAIEAMLEGE
ncbi:hypothetical protein I316_01276 [Kwoniella heveanensis BCC8398]|uniref:Uncharacterized protein n=1 Tax=Kwoniella heveanensis BCC8398 TaxID=1296120 RepID=A0A1B9H093_9TREE|nr:hypothetical protein I316_01276 [Kwoniella heveanensis BCC8398]